MWHSITIFRYTSTVFSFFQSNLCFKILNYNFLLSQLQITVILLLPLPLNPENPSLFFLIAWNSIYRRSIIWRFHLLSTSPVDELDSLWKRRPRRQRMYAAQPSQLSRERLTRHSCYWTTNAHRPRFAMNLKRLRKFTPISSKSMKHKRCFWVTKNIPKRKIGWRNVLSSMLISLSMLMLLPK